MMPFGVFLIAYRSYHCVIHHSGLRLKWTFQRSSLYKTGSLLKWNFRRWYYAMLRIKGLHCSLIAIYIHAIVILVYPILLLEKQHKKVVNSILYVTQATFCQ